MGKKQIHTVHMIHKCNDGICNCCKVRPYLLFRMVGLLLFLCLLISALLMCLLVGKLLLCLLLVTATVLQMYKTFLQQDANRYYMDNE